MDSPFVMTMPFKKLFALICCALFLFGSCRNGTNITTSVNYNVHTFYYAWFGSSEFDGEYNNWNHSIIPHWIDSTWNNAGNYPGGDDIGANYYPQLGCYSSNDPQVIKRHVKQIKKAGIGVLAFSWWGEGSFSDRSVSTYLDVANRYGLKITFHIEPIYKTVEQFKGQLEYLVLNYSDHPAFYKVDGKPLYYIYDGYKLNYRMWNSMLSYESETTIRNTSLDAIFISLWTLRKDGEFAVVSGFDGVYTYYGSDGYAYGSTTSNWENMARYARENDLLFIPCAGPGYLDTRIRPWNDRTSRSRDNGNYYERMFMSASNTNPDFLGITSFNEWHEGTQIEPAVPKTISSFTYEDYGLHTDPLFYIKKTRELIRKHEKARVKNMPK
jgi:glycoprotein endo-alpha-1,2-mannosidase